MVILLQDFMPYGIIFMNMCIVITSQNGELHNLYLSPDNNRQIKLKRMRWAGHVARMRKGRKAHKLLLGKPEGKRSFGRPSRKWKDGIKMHLREID
jgi:hypothetical protein